MLIRVISSLTFFPDNTVGREAHGLFVKPEPFNGPAENFLFIKVEPVHSALNIEESADAVQEFYVPFSKPYPAAVNPEHPSDFILIECSALTMLEKYGLPAAFEESGTLEGPHNAFVWAYAPEPNKGIIASLNILYGRLETQPQASEDWQWASERQPSFFKLYAD